MRHLDERNFDRALESAKGLVLVDFYADWCGPCRALSPILESLAPEYEGRVDFVKVDSDKSQRITQAFGVRSLPTVVVLKPKHPGPGAEVVGYFIGAKPADGVRKVLDKALDDRPGFFQRLFGKGGAKADDAKPDA